MVEKIENKNRKKSQSILIQLQVNWVLRKEEENKKIKSTQKTMIIEEIVIILEEPTQMKIALIEILIMQKDQVVPVDIITKDRDQENTKVILVKSLDNRVTLKREVDMMRESTIHRDKVP